MINLKTKLQFLKFVWIIPLFFLFLCFRKSVLNTHYYKEGFTTFTGIVTELKEEKEKNTLVVKTKEKIQVYDYQKHAIQLGDMITIKGVLKEPTNTRVFHTFRYAYYLKSKKIFWLCTAEEIILERENTNWFYQVKQNLMNYLKKQKNYPYLFAFILGDTSYLEEQKEVFQQLGISHLFAISGMHISLIAMVLTMILNRFLKEKLTFCLICSFLLFYLFLTGGSPSIIRATMMYCCLPIFKIAPTKLLLILFFLLLSYNPYYLYHLGFVFSFTVSFYILQFQKEIKKRDGYFKKLCHLSFISFFASLPILLFQFHEVNVMTIVFNIVFVPFVTFFLFPITILTFLFPFLQPILSMVITLFEYLLNSFSIFSYFVIFPHIPFYFYILEFFFSYFFLYDFYHQKCLPLLLIIAFFLFHYSYMTLFGKDSITFIDVGQGDATLIHLAHNQGSILIDTGGIPTYGRKENPFLVKTRIIPYLKSLGIKKLDYLILSHGDYDHMGEASYLVENFKVGKVILNNGKYHDLELNLIKVLEQKNIPYYQNMKELNINKYQFYFLNQKRYDNENDNSIVLYTKINQHKLLFMGDASKEVEENFIENDNLNNIDILKVGHHGSKTSSSEEFIDKVDPKYSIISVGENNRYGHPNNEVLDILDSSTIYRTDKQGSIMFLLKDKLEIETCMP